jgi:hypothetical protein
MVGQRREHCKLLISMTSAGQLAALLPPPYFVLIERALRDEGASYHYQPPAPFGDAGAGLLAALQVLLIAGCGATKVSARRGLSTMI